MIRVERTPFEQALLDVTLEELSGVSHGKDIEIMVSQRFQKKCQQLLQRTQRRAVHHISTKDRQKHS